jgi:hypothetical protein
LPHRTKDCRCDGAAPAKNRHALPRISHFSSSVYFITWLCAAPRPDSFVNYRYFAGRTSSRKAIILALLWQFLRAVAHRQFAELAAPALWSFFEGSTKATYKSRGENINMHFIFTGTPNKKKGGGGGETPAECSPGFNRREEFRIPD